MFTINKRHSEIAEFCSKGETAIKYVLVKNENNKTTFVATDGKALIHIEAPNHAEDFPDVGLPSNGENNTTLIPGTKWKEILKSLPLPKKTRHPILTNVLVSPQKNNGAVIGQTDLEKVSKTTIPEQVWSRYPEYEYLLAPNPEENLTIRFTPDLLQKILSAVITMEADYIDFHFTSDPHNLIRFSSETPHGDKIKGAIAPQKQPEKEELTESEEEPNA